jgi:hypothetical protein
MNLSLLKKHKADVILISTLLAIAIIGWIILYLNKTVGGYAVVVVNGVETQSYSLNKDSETVLRNGDEYNILVIRNGEAYIIEASCPDKLCTKQQPVKYNGETLVCLPNKTTVKIVSKVDSGHDFIS